MSFGVVPALSSSATGASDNVNDAETGTAAVGEGDYWFQFNTRLAQLRQEKGDQSAEVQQLTKAAQDSLQAYYNSSAYREWYANYCKQLEEENKRTMGSSTGERAATAKQTVQRPPNATHLRPADRVRGVLSTQLDGDDPDDALARAEAEQVAGVPLQSVDSSAATASDAVAVNAEADSKDIQSPDTAAPPVVVGKRKQNAPPPAWYEVSLRRWG